MASITFFGNPSGTTPSLGGSLIDQSVSGIGFFGGDFGLSVPVDSYQTTTFITNSDGTTQGAKISNTKRASESGVQHDTGNEINNEAMPNYYAPLNIRFNHDEAVRVKNCQLRIFDRSDITKHASGVTTEVYEIRHPHETEDANKALNHRPLPVNHSWVTFVYDGNENTVDPMVLTNSPGMSGLNGVDSDQSDGTLSSFPDATFGGDGHESLQHDWYIALSASPNEIGSKTDFGLYFTLEYL